jgi:hypothetical protein
MEKRRSWEADSRSAGGTAFMEPNISLRCSQKPVTSPYLELDHCIPHLSQQFS